MRIKKLLLGNKFKKKNMIGLISTGSMENDIGNLKENQRREMKK